MRRASNHARLVVPRATQREAVRRRRGTSSGSVGPDTGAETRRCVLMPPCPPPVILGEARRAAGKGTRSAMPVKKEAQR